MLHALHYLFLDTPLRNQFSMIEIFAALLAAIAHDIDHPGANNNFLVKSKSPMAILYNDISVNEFHHAAYMFSLTLDGKIDLFSEMEVADYTDCRQLIIKMILSTDMAKVSYFFINVIIFEQKVERRRVKRTIKIFSHLTCIKNIYFLFFSIHQYILFLAFRIFNKI